MRSLVIASLGFLSMFAGPQHGSAATIIEYETTDLPDMPGAGDRWAYRYYVSGFSFRANEGFTIWFDAAASTSLVSPTAPNTDWSAIVLQPDVLLPADGAFDAIALVNTPSPLAPFAVEFVYLGGMPGSQRFDVTRFDANGNLVEVIESGFTIPRQQPGAIPEPMTGMLAVSGLALLMLGAGWSRTRQRRKAPLAARM